MNLARLPQQALFFDFYIIDNDFQLQEKNAVFLKIIAFSLPAAFTLLCKNP